MRKKAVKNVAKVDKVVVVVDHRNLSLKFGQNGLNNSRDIADIECLWVADCGGLI